MAKKSGYRKEMGATKHPNIKQALETKTKSKKRKKKFTSSSDVRNRQVLVLNNGRSPRSTLYGWFHPNKSNYSLATLKTGQNCEWKMPS